MSNDSRPDDQYTRTWAGGRGEVRFFTRSDGSRLRYLVAGTGRPLVLLHTVRGQLDYFQRVIPLLWDHYTVYALDLPGMGWSDIVPGARYEEPQLRAALVEFVTGLDLRDVTLAGESLGAALSLTASIDLEDRTSRIVAFNSYDYPEGGMRGNGIARAVMTAVRAPVLGAIAGRMEPRNILRDILRGGYVDTSKLPEHFVDELSRSGRRHDYWRVSRAIFRSLESFDRARERYGRISTPVTLVYSENDWSKPHERERVAKALRNVEVITLARTGHFSALEDPATMGRILLTPASA
ncbi:alpha/beta fold hydrolase [Microbacterium karelineae]|uniref:alpha/beta fold hydrolase n=1 Tax=Microbacterium karelineae TaxID=2654283 RepID=UPI0012EA8A9A|nr:alpha/beta hydrolase [Microbacterium karelineae]